MSSTFSEEITGTPVSHFLPCADNLQLRLILTTLEYLAVNPALPTEKPELSLLSQQIAVLELEHVTLEKEVIRLSDLLVRKAEVEMRINFYRQLEVTHARMCR